MDCIFYLHAFYSLVGQESEPGLTENVVINLLFDLLAYVVDIMAFILPRTPEDIKLGSLLTGFINYQTESFANYFIVSIFTGLAGILVMAAIYKLIKILPLT